MTYRLAMWSLSGSWLEVSYLAIFGLDLGNTFFDGRRTAECFDALCPCGKEHDPETPRKLRTRIEKAFPPAWALGIP